MSGKEQLLPGLRHSESVSVTNGLTVSEISPAFTGLDDMPPVFATAYVLAFVEWTCLELVKPYLEPGERTVGTGITMQHTAATPVGMTATAEVELTAVNGRMLEFAFICRDDVEVIAKGTHGRAIIDLERFMGKLAQKG